MDQTTAREYSVAARSTDTFGRVLCSARNHHHIIDGPVQNGCPGEEITPVEAFLSGVAACGVELVQVIARDQSLPLRRVAVSMSGMIDRSRQPREGVTLFNSVTMDFVLEGVSDSEAAALIDAFKQR
ncbi:MAG TPA: hypothetical protein VMT00_02940 [Thermoanaerobaculia bacterium]|nr:hypothetical protein [Thermoanaerobaculia bacterium]